MRCLWCQAEPSGNDLSTTLAEISMRMLLVTHTTVALLLGCNACSASRENSQPERPPIVTTDSAGALTAMPGITSAPAMAGMAVSSEAIRRMRLLLDSVGATQGRTVIGMIPAHRTITANLLANMQSDMTAMSMPGDASWTTTVDSVRQDLVRLAELTPAETLALMPAHRARVLRLLAMHSAMMSPPRP